jgi:hypothetical protein
MGLEVPAEQPEDIKTPPNIPISCSSVLGRAVVKGGPEPGSTGGSHSTPDTSEKLGNHANPGMTRQPQLQVVLQFPTSRTGVT